MRRVLRLAASVILSGVLVGGAVASEPEPIIIGAPLALTGGFGETGILGQAGLDIAMKQINDSGGIKSLGGAKLKLVVADTSSDNPTQAASVARRLIEQDHAIVLAGAVASTMTLAAQVEAERAEVPIVTTSYADDIVKRGYKYTFKVSLPTGTMFGYMIDYASQLIADVTGKPPRRIQAVVGSDASSQGMAASVAKVAASRNLEVADTVTFQNNLTDATAIITSVLQSKPDLIITSGFAQDTVLLLRSLRGVGIKTPAIALSGSVGTNEMGKALGDGAQGYMGAETYNWDLNTPGNQAAVERYHADHPNLPFPPDSEQFGMCYAAGMLIADALEKAASRDPKVIRDTLATIQSPTVFPGGTISFDDKGLNKDVTPILVMWVEGKLRTVWPKQFQTVQPKF